MAAGVRTKAASAVARLSASKIDAKRGGVAATAVASGSPRLQPRAEISSIDRSKRGVGGALAKATKPLKALACGIIGVTTAFTIQPMHALQLAFTSCCIPRRKAQQSVHCAWRPSLKEH